MSLDTLLEAAMYLESSTKSASKVFSASARAANESNTQTRRNRTISESSEGSERRRRPGGAGTRETHNKLEKNRRAHLKECFDILKSEVPGLEDKKTSNLNILRSALKYIQTLKKHEREFEIERDSLKAGNGLLKERLQALKKDIETKDCKRDATKNVMQNELSGKIVSPLNSRLASVEKAGQICPVSVATQTALSPVKTEAPNFLEDLSNASIHSESTESTQEDEYVDIDGCDDDEKHILVDVGDVIEQKEEISKVEENKEGILARKSNGLEKKLKRNNIIKYSESVEGAPVVTNGALQDTTLRSRSIFDVDSNGETSQEEFDYDSFKPKIQSCARVSC